MMARVTPAPAHWREARPGPSRKRSPCDESRGGAPEGERAPKADKWRRLRALVRDGPPPRPRMFRRQCLNVLRGDMVDAPFGAPPPFFYVLGRRLFRCLTKLGRKKRAARTGLLIHLAPRAGRGRAKRG